MNNIESVVIAKWFDSEDKDLVDEYHPLSLLLADCYAYRYSYEERKAVEEKVENIAKLILASEKGTKFKITLEKVKE